MGGRGHWLPGKRERFCRRLVCGTVHPHAGPATGAVRVEVTAMHQETEAGMKPVDVAQKGEPVYLAVPEQARHRDKVTCCAPGRWRMCKDCMPMM